jgi:putative salt-induced outer membrane protein YdiY
MPWTAVRSIRSDAPVTVELPGSPAVAGRIATEGDRLQVVTATTTETAPLTTVGAIRDPAEQATFERLQHPGLLELWTGFFDLGLAAARGNAHTASETMTFNAARITRHDKLTVTFNQIYAGARVNGLNNTTASAWHGGWAYNRDLTPRFFLTLFNQYDHDRFQNLQLRFVLGGGAGYNVIKTPNTTLGLVGGVDYSHENFAASVSRNSAEATFGDDFIHKMTANTAITQSFRIFPNLSNTGEYRVNFDLGAVTAIKKWLGWQVTASDRYLSNPLFGRQRNDLLLSTGLRLSFGTLSK